MNKLGCVLDRLFGCNSGNGEIFPGRVSSGIMPLLTGRRLERALASKQFRVGRFHNTSGLSPDGRGTSLATIPASKTATDDLIGGRKCPVYRTLHAGMTVLHAIGIWNELILPTIYLTNQKYYPITRGLIVFQGVYGSSWPTLAAAATRGFRAAR